MLANLLRIAVLWELLWAGGIALLLHDSAGWPWVGAVVAGLATPLTVHAGIVAAGFAGALRDGEPSVPSLSLQALGRMFVLEFLASVRAFQWEMPWTARRALPGSTGPVTTARPVLLIHGYLCNRQVWRPMARFLADRGHPVEAVDLEPVFGTIDAYAIVVREGVDRLRSRTGASKVTLVCHSMGGLAARAYLRRFGDAAVDCVVTIGSPHRGTRNAFRGPGQNAEQMRPDSDWLRALAESEREASDDPPSAGGDGVRADPATRPARPFHDIRFTVILSRHDNVVVPQSTQTLDGADTVQFDGIGHVRLVSDPAVMAAVEEALKQAPGRPGLPAPLSGTGRTQTGSGSA